MKPAYLCAFASLTSLATSQLIVPLHHRGKGKAIPPPLRGDIQDSSGDHQQQPLMDPVGPPVPALPPGPPSDEQPPSSSPGGGGGLLITDVMGRDRSINIFAGLARDTEEVSRRLDDAGQNSTVLAPLNSAVEGLPRKPWEDPRDYSGLGEAAYEGGEGEERARRNIQRFVEAHVVPASPWGEGRRVRTVDGGEREVWWEDRDGVKVIQPDGIEVVGVAGSVSNGQVWIIKGVRNYA
ncbi:hypothetical protein NKR23_g11049 [Pleurostoma richardsiae]|uniref:FAS1 domain-containing protein n=1 Tax=Pleurostoma richardsiae TaxID=41990 RepID=A0AA38R438_9PEZI|nr:hypothetical protein NKR23_g11049 [Pleurostoma richardsiae]